MGYSPVYALISINGAICSLFTGTCIGRKGGADDERRKPVSSSESGKQSRLIEAKVAGIPAVCQSQIACMDGGLLDPIDYCVGVLRLLVARMVDFGAYAQTDV